MQAEIVLLTKSYNAIDLREWLDWHLRRCRFDIVHIIDNESPIDVESIAKDYIDNGQVTYTKVSGRPLQYKIYDEYVNKIHSKKRWVICLDDDEYFYFNPEKFESVKDVIETYKKKFPSMKMLSVVWKFMWPEDLFAERNGKSTLKFCTNDSKLFTLGIIGKKRAFLVKTLVNTAGKVHYQTSEENPDGGHIPRHSEIRYALTCNGDLLFSNKSTGMFSYESVQNHDIRILHCKYRSLEDFMSKSHAQVSSVKDKTKVSDKLIIKNIKRLGMRKP